MTQILYGIGDIHGRDDLLEKLHENISAYHTAYHNNEPAKIIYIGDYIDIGANSKSVIDRVMKGLPQFESIYLKGNHEDMLLNCLNSDSRETWITWLNNGGEQTLSSFYISPRFGGYHPEELVLALGKKRLDWLQSLKLYYQTDNYLFVHAGIMPGVPLEKQEEKDLLWIRSRFLNSKENHGLCVIHGHTPTDDPDIRTNRIGIDTGAVSSGKLTAILLNGVKEPRFFTAIGKPGSGPQSY